MKIAKTQAVAMPQATQTVTMSQHFVSVAEVPVIDETTTLRDAFKQLADKNKGGFILARNDTPLAFIIGSQLPNLAQVRRRKLAKLVDQRLTDLSDDLAGIRLTVASSAIEASMDVASLGAAVYLDGVFEIRDGVKRTGWLFTKERWSCTVYATPPNFRCENGHDNPDPDSGQCSQFQHGMRCHARIVGW